MKEVTGPAWLLDGKARGCGASCYGFHSSNGKVGSLIEDLQDEANWNHVLDHCSMCTLPFRKSQAMPVLRHTLSKHWGSLALQETETR